MAITPLDEGNNMNAHDFLVKCPDEVVTRARIALRHILAGNWNDAANQYAMIAVDLGKDSMANHAESLSSLCRQCSDKFTR